MTGTIFLHSDPALIPDSPGRLPCSQARERPVARLQRVAPQVLAIQLEEVEGVEEDMLALAPQLLEHRKPVWDERFRLERFDRH